MVESMYLSAFDHLSTCRLQGDWGAARIPYRDVIAYADRLGLEDVASELFVFVINAMDRSFLSDLREQMAAERKKAGLSG